MNKKIKPETPATEHKKSNSAKKKSNHHKVKPTPEKADDTTALVALEKQNMQATMPLEKITPENVTAPSLTEKKSLTEKASTKQAATEETISPIIEESPTENILPIETTENLAEPVKE